MTGDDPLQRLARAVADGSHVDWEGEAAARPDLASRLAQMRILHAVGAQRHLAPESAPGQLLEGGPGSMEGRTLSHYRILEKVGAGGMGVVYRAHDERLERDVALKVLPPGLLSDDAARKRFRKEALALSRLNHPNIETVHDFDSHAGVDFLVMEYIPGQTLTQILANGPLAGKQVATLGAQIASALEEAHARGVTHRDLKPGNIMVTPREQAKVLDFGLAMLPRPTGEPSKLETMSQSGAVVGTLPYMAPEQIRGEKVDFRSDIYAAGAVLFEMATRRRPFLQESAPRLIYAILHEAPPAPSAIDKAIAPALDGIILKALDRDPKRRYQSATELRVDLERLGGSAPLRAAPRRAPVVVRWWLPAVAGAFLALAAVLLLFNVGGLKERLLGRFMPTHTRSLAVLPLANLSGNPEQEYFADGITEELITSLAKIGALRVTSRTSVMRYKGTTRPIPEIAHALGVDAVVEGSVRLAGGRVRVTAQLIDAATNRHLWAESYERDLRDVLTLQSEVAQAIAGEIRVKVLPEEKARLADAHQVDPEAYQAYLMGRHFQEQRTVAGAEKSVEYFEQAIQGNPNDARSYAAEANSYVLLSVYGALPTVEANRKAKSLAARALEIDETLAAAHAAMAAVLEDEWDWPGAEREHRRAIELNPNDAHTRHWYGEMLIYLGRFTEARAEIDRAAELDPLSPAVVGAVGDPLFNGRQYDLAIQEYRKALLINPNHAVTHRDLGQTYLYAGMHEKALVEIQAAIDLSGNQADYVALLALVHAVAGRRTEALRVLESLKQPTNRQEDVPVDVAVVYAALGEMDRAFEWLEKAYDQRAYALVWIKVSPLLDPLRSDPRFKDLMRRVGLPPD